MYDKAPVSFRINVELQNQLSQMAAEKRVTESAVIREALVMLAKNFIIDKRNADLMKQFR